MDRNISLLTLVVIIVHLSLSLYHELFLLTEGLYFNSLIGNYSVEKIEELLIQKDRFKWLGFLLVPVFYLLKIWIITSVLYLVKIILGKTFQATFSDISLAVIKADMIFLIPALIKITWFTFYPAQTLEEIQYFMPGSAYQLFAGEEIAPWLIYPLQAFSVWEVAFWIILAFQLKEFFENDFTKSLQNVMLSYGSGFLVWIVFVVFLTINMT